MFRPRIIPVLLLKDQVLVKTVRFGNPKYIGDPINAVKIFNDLKADELVFLDIKATRESRCISVDFVREVGEEANMPFAVGGGISTIEQIRELTNAGAEKVIINTQAVLNKEFIRKASDTFGASTIVVCMDVKKKFLGDEQTYIINGTKASGLNPVEFAIEMQHQGAGEIIVQSIDHDGTMNGYDLNLIAKISAAVTIPVVALGGAGNLQHMRDAYHQAHATALAAGSMFVFYGPNKAVLINYPAAEEISCF
ncbi:MAG: imidazole glycerol phosphate synthase subunit HisF [Bacteroidetes bacterium GWF2_43_63]|nr:MAG: imidazole glycerol phosphate synthase subunit HisF [Bacteroidetes bacterium GWE2_42_42]OFY53010.1 MAG: imidazole glycerol phosphate synthase subunit HisF [Bacteroidetes bacterium GWF2_43_63]HBG70198.1 imidazole glycerol phosphate synthase subunit HisF [Bacteroidales bacterium]HCB62194.1 imidazole glycerol phosphate synthase subunit HisF [Bacteroidales bacterium]